jgi:CHAT domain-containing protein
LQFRQSLAKDTYPIIHLATHAKVSSQPENSFIVTGDFQKVRVHEMDDLIDLREQENPEPIELLFLSACNTAAGDTRAPMGIAGMTVAAGARSAIASLWYAEDKKSTQLVREFYEIWRENPTWTKAKVLQESQKTLIQSGVLEPVYWANYSLLGNWL